MIPRVGARFSIEHRAGAGGMGTVYAARDAEGGGRVALKVIASEALDPDARARFLREAELLSEVHHPALVRYVARGLTDDGAPFLAMEWLDGEDLGIALARGPLSVAAAVFLARRVAGALAALHVRGVVHRDVKPSNVLLVEGSPERATLIDLGVARDASPHQRVTRTGTIVGTPGYMSPEQTRGEAVDARTDLFSLGCVLYECLVGRPAFASPGVVATLARVLLEDVRPPSEDRPGIPPPLDALVLALLAKAPDGRPATAEQVDRALAALGDDLPRLVASGQASPSLRVVTSSERRVVSIVLARLPSRTLTEDEARAVDVVTESHGRRASLLAEGTLLVTFDGEGTAADRAAEAAYVALSLRSALEGIPVSIATGRMVVDGSTRPIGETVDEALRGLSDVPRVVVDPTTASLLEARFEVREAAAARELVGARQLGVVPRTLLGRASPCVGRDRDVGMLLSTLDECVDASAARVVVLAGPAGIGKSRILSEFLVRAGQRATPPDVWLAQGGAGADASPFALAVSALKRAAGWAEGEPVLLRQAKLAAFVHERCGPGAESRVTAPLADLSGAPLDGGAAPRLDPVAHGDRIRRAFEELLAGASRLAPVVFVVEDLHFGDLPSVSLLDGALRQLRERPFLVVALARPEQLRIPNVWSSHARVELRLGPLPRHACERVVREALGAVSEERVASIVGRAQGNPACLEELVRAVHDGRRDDELPDTLVALVEARFDLLSPEARRALRAASVFGDRFRRGGVVRCLGGSGAGLREIDAALDELTEREIVENATGAPLADDRELVFRSDLFREAAYGMLPPDDRAAAHRRAAKWLEAAGEVDPHTLADHWEKSGAPDRAVPWRLREAEDTLAGNDLPGALAVLARIDALGAAGEEKGRARLLAAQVHRWYGGHDDGYRAGVEALELLPPSGPDYWVAAAATVTNATASGRGEEAVAVCARVLDQPEAELLPELASIVAFTCVFALMHKSRHDEAARVHARGRRLVEAAVLANRPRAPLLRAQGYLLGAAADVASGRGDPSAVATYSPAANLFREAGDLRTACGLEVRSACGFLELGEYTRAEALLRTARADADAMGLRRIVVTADVNRGHALALLGRPDEGIELLERCLGQEDQLGPRGLAFTRLYLAIAFFDRGELDKAEAEISLAIAAIDDRADPATLAPAALLAGVRLKRGDSAGARSAAREAAARLTKLGALEEHESMAWRHVVEALLSEGPTEEALAALSTAAARLEARAAAIADSALRQSFLGRVDDNRRLRELAARLLEGAP